MPRDNICMYMAHVCFYVCCSDCVGVCGNVCCVAAVLKYSGFAMPFLYSSSVKGNTSEESSSPIGDNLGHLGFVGISPRPLTSSWCATWLAVTRQGFWSCWIVRDLSDCLPCLPAVASQISLCHHLLLLSTAILLNSSLPVSRVVLSKGLLRYCLLHASYMLFDSSDRPGM